MLCFGENVEKCYIKGKILYLRDFIWCFFFSDVHARQRVSLYILLK